MPGRERMLWTIMCGAALGVAVLIRPTNTLLAFPILVGLGLQPLRLIGAALGALPAGLFAVYLNLRLFGVALTTGYGSPSVSYTYAIIFRISRIGSSYIWVRSSFLPLRCLFFG